MSPRAMQLAGGIVFLLSALFAATALTAQQQDDLNVLDQADPPRSEVATDYRDAAHAQRIETEAIYATETQIGPTDNTPIRRADRTRNRTVPVGGPWGIVGVILFILVVILLWLRFGGTGVLLSRAPGELQNKTVAPEAWKISAQDQQAGPDSLLAQLRAMPDRGEALARLLRHALLAAGQDSGTRYARADTEREAFARLPHSWTHHKALANLLRAAELAHYGGRPVSDTAFEQALEIGRTILTAGGRHA